MRTIKFRAFWKEAKIMVDVESIRKNGAIEFLVPVKSGEKEWKEVQILDEQVQYELMQFTGLLDSKGKEIWEGDIVKFEYHNSGGFSNPIEKVVFSRGAFRIFGDCIDEHIGTIEIIGNVFETPELLK